MYVELLMRGLFMLFAWMPLKISTGHNFCQLVRLQPTFSMPVLQVLDVQPIST